jgi:excisionase family DNA binding protein
MVELLTLDEVAARLKCSRRQLDRIILSGHLRKIRLQPGNSPRVTERELGAYLASLEGRPIR